jgi:acetolactate synthase-1/2/3 large subunit
MNYKTETANDAAVAIEAAGTRQARRVMTGADIVVETLEARGTKHVFGVSGAKIDKIYDRLLDSSIQTVVCRHEQNAAFIAGGIGRLTGKAGVALVTSGPGVSNLVTGLATAGFGGLMQAGHEVFRRDRFASSYLGSPFCGFSSGRV